MAKLTPKQKIFCNEYIKDFNSESAAVRAGYDEKKAKFYGDKNLHKTEIKAYIDYILAKQKTENQSHSVQKNFNDIANADEVMKYLTDIMRGDAENIFGDNLITPKDRIKAAELLGKRYSLFTYNFKTDNNCAIQIIDNIPLEIAKNGDENG